MTKSNIALMGIKHCGKSTLGRMLSEDLKRAFYDIDSLIEENYNKSVREILKHEKKEGFLKVEAEVICSLASGLLIKKNSVISLGGGAIENSKAIQCLQNTAFLVFLNEDKDILFNRIIQNGLPPFLSAIDPYNDFIKIYEKRKKLYEKKADLIINIEGKEILSAYELLKEKIKEAGYVG